MEDNDEKAARKKEERKRKRFEEKCENLSPMSWVSTLIEGRLLVGPKPSAQNDALYLTEKMGVTHMINMKPLTEETTAKTKLNRATWQESLFSTVSFHREPLPNDFSTLSDAKKMSLYVAAAKRVVSWMRDQKGGVYYIHNETGFDEEAFLGILVWSLFDKVSFPGPNALGEWLTEHALERLLDSEDQRALLQKTLAFATKGEGGGILTWLQRKKV